MHSLAVPRSGSPGGRDSNVALNTLACDEPAEGDENNTRLRHLLSGPAALQCTTSMTSEKKTDRQTERQNHNNVSACVKPVEAYWGSQLSLCSALKTPNLSIFYFSPPVCLSVSRSLPVPQQSEAADEREIRKEMSGKPG